MMGTSFEDRLIDEITPENPPLRVVAVLIYEEAMEARILFPFLLTRDQAVQECLTGEKLARRAKATLRQIRGLQFMDYILVPPCANIAFQHQEPGHRFAYGNSIWNKVDEHLAVPICGDRPHVIPFEKDTAVFPAL